MGKGDRRTVPSTVVDRLFVYGTLRAGQTSRSRHSIVPSRGNCPWLPAYTMTGSSPATSATAPAPAAARDPNVLQLEARLADTLGAQVSIEHAARGGKGKVVIRYNSLDELDGILAHIS